MHTRKIFAKGATLPGKQEYSRMVRAVSRKTNVAATTAKAFLIGGSICLLGQVLLSIYTGLGLDDTDAGTAVSLTLILLSVLLTAAGIYDRIAKHGGAGTLVPITGFANAVAAPAVEFKTEGFVTGVGVKIFTIAGPVILYGTLAGTAVGLIRYIFF